MSWRSRWGRISRLEWRELDIRDADQWSPGWQWLSCVLLAVVLYAVSHVYWVLPTIKELEALRREEGELLQAYRDEVARIALLPGLEAQVAMLEQRLAMMEVAFPKDADMALLSDDIGMAALERQLSIEMLQLEDTVEGRFVDVHPITLRVAGPYRHLGGFIADVANFPRLVTLHEIRLEAFRGHWQLSLQARAYSTCRSDRREAEA